MVVAPEAIAVGADSKTVLVGAPIASSSPPRHTQFVVLRLGLNGATDTTFGTGGQVATGFTGTVDSVATSDVVQTDGKVIVVGSAGENIALARYNPDGSLDATFGSGGRVTTDPAVDPLLAGFGSFVGVAIQADGKIVVASGRAVLRYNPDGTLDPTFGTAGIVTNVAGFAGANPLIQRDGKILVVGEGLTRFNSDGSLDSTFGQGGKVQVSGGGGLALQPDGKILVDSASNGSVQLTCYNADGSLDSSFGTGGMVSISPGVASGIAVQSNGQIVVGSPVARFNPGGSFDPLFGRNGQGVSVTLGGQVIIAPDGDIIAGGAIGIAIYKPNGTLDVRFGNAGLVTPDFAPGNFALQPDGSIVLTGTTTLSGHTIITVARYLTTGGSSLTPNQLFIAQVYPDLLQRPADPGGLAFWSCLLDGGLSRAQVVQKMQATPEYHTVLVNNLYNRILGRNPDTSGDATWLNFLNQGGTEEQLEAMFLGSDEFFAKHGSNNSQGFLPALYQIVLQRPIDAGGLQSWSQALAGGMSRTAVAVAVLASLESDRLEMQMLYAAFLHRPPDASGLDTYTNLLQQGVPNETVASILISSEEYFAQI
jgi:uncharacterized delta-60 repeat protein